jgi:hypothetical protein
MTGSFTSNDLGDDGPLPVQPPCNPETCGTDFRCNDQEPGGCIAASWMSAGPCRVTGCTCYGTTVDDGLCSGCHWATK